MKVILLKACVTVLSMVLISGQHQRPPGVPDPNVQNMQQQRQPPVDPAYVEVEEGRSNFGRKDVHNAEHIKEHLKEVVDKPKEQMTEEELEFHYFKLHDYDNNNMLDGVEIQKAITHFHADEEEPEKETDTQRKIFTDAEISQIVDLVLKEDDLNDDGYIEYPEFVTAQRKTRDNKDNL